MACDFSLGNTFYYKLLDIFLLWTSLQIASTLLYKLSECFPIID